MSPHLGATSGRLLRGGDMQARLKLRASLFNLQPAPKQFRFRRILRLFFKRLVYYKVVDKNIVTNKQK